MCCCRRTSTRARRKSPSCQRLFPWAADYLAIYERYAIQRRAIGDGAQRSRDRRPSSSGSPPRARRSRIVPAATPRSAADVSRCVVTSTRVSRARLAPSGRRAGIRHAEGRAAGVSDAAARAGSDRCSMPARLLYLTTRAGARRLGSRTEIGDFQAGQGRGLRLSAAAGGQRAGGGGAPCRRSPAGARGAVYAGGGRRACAKCALKAISYLREE